MFKFNFDQNKRDADGQPLMKAFRQSAVADRQIDEMIGMVKGVLADGEVNNAEVAFLLKWMETNRSVRDIWPVNVLYPRLYKAMADGVIDESEQSELLSMLARAAGGNAAAVGEASMSTQLPLSNPQPTVRFENNLFCFTGKFFSGTRDWCETQVTSRAGRVAGSITKKLDYLVIGDIGSRDWIHSTHGRKIEKCVEYNGCGRTIAIIGEEHFSAHL